MIALLGRISCFIFCRIFLLSFIHVQHTRVHAVTYYLFLLRRIILELPRRQETAKIRIIFLCVLALMKWKVMLPICSYRWGFDRIPTNVSLI